MADAEKQPMDCTHALESLLALGPLRVWSVIITIFGDYSRFAKDALPGRKLQEIIHHLGIKDDALRVAIFRLKNDGWITATRHGRTSIYALTERGFNECKSARPRIYAKAPADADRVRLIILPPSHAQANGKASIDKGIFGHRITGRVMLTTKHESPEVPASLYLPVTASALPAWLREDLTPKVAYDGYIALENALETLLLCLRETAGPSAQERVALRILVIHRWRQLLLKHQDLPQHFFAPGWKGEACRKLVHTCLEKLPIPERPTRA